MSTDGEGDHSSSISSSSEQESESDEAREVSREAAAPPTAARSVQVVSAAPRGSDATDGADGTESSSSSSDSEEEPEEATADAEAPSRGKSYLQSIRARKPKKKVYVTPKSEDTILCSYTSYRYIIFT